MHTIIIFHWVDDSDLFSAEFPCCSILAGTRSHKQPVTLRILGGRLQEFRQYFNSSFPIAD